MAFRNPSFSSQTQSNLTGLENQLRRQRRRIPQMPSQASRSIQRPTMEEFQARNPGAKMWTPTSTGPQYDPRWRQPPGGNTGGAFGAPFVPQAPHSTSDGSIRRGPNDWRADAIGPDGYLRPGNYDAGGGMSMGVHFSRRPQPWQQPPGGQRPTTGGAFGAPFVPQAPHPTSDGSIRSIPGGSRGMGVPLDIGHGGPSWTPAEAEKRRRDWLVLNPPGSTRNPLVNTRYMREDGQQIDSFGREISVGRQREPSAAIRQQMREMAQPGYSDATGLPGGLTGLQRPIIGRRRPHRSRLQRGQRGSW